MSASPSSSQSGGGGEAQRIGPFEIGREIGKGSFAVVHRGLSRVVLPAGSSVRKGAQDVAIKIVNRRKLTAKLLENLEGEISIMRTIRHVHVVELLDCLSTEDRIYLVMPFCASGDLSHYIRNAPKSATEAAVRLNSNSSSSNSRHEYRHWEDGGLNESVVRSFLQQLASAMEFMRDRNIVHRDIKPQNLLLQPPDESLIAAGHRPGIPQLKVADFGFARNLPTATLAETLCGSPLYMAPEILRYEKYDAKADLWSVGAVLYEMSVGKPPFRAQNHVELLRKIERGEDRIRFPDERSEGSLAREQARREEMGEKGEVKKAHTVADDVKGLIRGLLKSKPMERMSFDGLFRCSIVEDVRADELVRARQIAAATQAVSASPPRPSPRPVEKSLPTAEAAPTPAAAPIKPSPQSVAPAPIVATTVPPPPPAVQRGFTSRYVVGGSSATPTSAAAPAAMTTPPASVPLPALARDPERVRRASAARRLSAQEAVAAVGADEHALETSASSVTPLVNANATASSARRGSEQSSSGVATPSGGADEDSILGREYVMVEKRNVEVNALADELAAGGAARGNIAASPPAAGLTRRPSRLSRLGSGLAAQLSSPAPAPASLTPAAHARTGSFAAPPSPVRLGTTPPSGTPFALPAGVARRPSFVRRSSLSGSSSPRPKVITAGVSAGNEEIVASSPSTSPLAEDARSSSALARAVPVPRSSIGGGYDSPRTSAIGPSLSPPMGAVGSTTNPSTVTAATPSGTWTAGPTSSALARAISMASVRLFGVPSGMSLRGAAALVRNRSSRRAALIRSGEYPDGAEAGLIVTLEDLGQKSFVLSEFADARLAAYFPMGPHQAGTGSPEADQASLSPSSGGGLVSGSLGRSQGMAFGRPSSGIRRTSSSNSSSTSGLMHDAHSSPQQQQQIQAISSASNATPAEVAAAEALLLYVKSLSFLQRGIDATKAFLEARSRPNAPAIASADVNDLVQWLRARFNDGYDRADFARSKCGEIPEAAQHVDKLIFDKALEIARGAALDELENNRVGVAWDANKCLLAYETASSMLTALLDPGEDAMDMSDGAAATIEKFLRSIDKRLQALQRRVGD